MTLFDLDTIHLNDMCESLLRLSIFIFHKSLTPRLIKLLPYLLGKNGIATEFNALN